METRYSSYSTCSDRKRKICRKSRSI